MSLNSVTPWWAMCSMLFKPAILNYSATYWQLKSALKTFCPPEIYMETRPYTTSHSSTKRTSSMPSFQSWAKKRISPSSLKTWLRSRIAKVDLRWTFLNLARLIAMSCSKIISLSWSPDRICQKQTYRWSECSCRVPRSFRSLRRLRDLPLQGHRVAQSSPR